MVLRWCEAYHPEVPIRAAWWPWAPTATYKTQDSYKLMLSLHSAMHCIQLHLSIVGTTYNCITIHICKEQCNAAFQCALRFTKLSYYHGPQMHWGPLLHSIVKPVIYVYIYALLWSQCVEKHLSTIVKMCHKLAWTLYYVLQMCAKSVTNVL